MSSASRAPAGRRRFLKTVGLAGISSALAAAATSVAQSPPGAAPAKPEAPVPAAPADTSQGAAARPPEISEDARALTAIIERRYGQHLSKEQLEAITKDFDGDLKATKRMRDVKLGNADEPDSIFRA
jgi:hypothetical protein